MISLMVAAMSWTLFSGAAGDLPQINASLQKATAPVRVVCFGDSVTGIYYHTGSRRAYSDMLEIALKRLYPAAQVSVLNAGVSGNTTVDALGRVDKDVIDKHPQLVTVMFGLNDITRVSPEDYAANLATIVAKCRAAGSEVLLCTPNGVFESGGRPIAKLEQYIAVLRKVGAEQKVPVADCYAAFQAVREKDARAFACLMSDEIHPNMDGHKLLASMLAEAITGRAVSLDDVGALSPAIPKTIALLKDRKPVKVYAMPPFDKLIAPALMAGFPDAKVTVTAWAVDGKTLKQIEEDAKKVREMGQDLVIVAVPMSAGVDAPDKFPRAYTWILNYALSFEHYGWDVVAVAPSVVNTGLTAEEETKDTFIRQLIRAQDVGSISREKGDAAPVETVLGKWVKGQVKD